MTSAELRAFLAETGLSISQVAQLIGVTRRAVALWLSGERTVPGPASAYANLFRALRPADRQRELLRLKEDNLTMRDGMYAIQYRSAGGGGYATAVFDRGRLYGADPFGGSYDGEYGPDDETGLVRVRVKVTLPPNVAAVFGPAQPFEWSVDLVGNMDPRVERGFAQFRPPMGPLIEAQYQFLREVPAWQRFE